MTGKVNITDRYAEVLLVYTFSITKLSYKQA